MASNKGIVIEKGINWAIIMLPDGEYKKIKTNHYLEIGELYQEANLLPIKYVAAAVILLTILLGSVDYYSVKAYAHVSSLAELGVNRWGRVISVKATDNNGKQLLSQVEVKNDKLEVAVEKICSQALKDKSSQVYPSKQVLSIKSTQQDQSQLEEKLLKKMDNGLKKAWQSQKQRNDTKDLNKNKVQPQGNKSHNKIKPNQNSKNPDSNPKQDIKAEILKDQSKDGDHQVNSIEPIKKDHSYKKNSAKQLKYHKNSEFKRDITNEKNKMKYKGRHSNRVDGK